MNLSHNARIDNFKNVEHDMFAVNDGLRLFSDLSPVVILAQQYIFLLLNWVPLQCMCEVMNINAIWICRQ